MKRPVICSLCNKDLGRFHDNASAVPLRDHIYLEHPKDYKIILEIVSKIDAGYEKLKKYKVSHWSKIYFHNNIKLEKELENTPPLTEEKRKALIEKIMKE